MDQNVVLLTIVGMGGCDATELTRGKRFGHEGELRALYGDRRAPKSHVLLPSQPKQCLPRLQRIRNRLLAPYVFAGFQRSTVDLFVLLHIGQIDEKVKRLTRQHGFDVRVVMADLESLCLPLGPLRLPVGQSLGRPINGCADAGRRQGHEPGPQRRRRMKQTAAHAWKGEQQAAADKQGHGVKDQRPQQGPHLSSRPLSTP